MQLFQKGGVAIAAQWSLASQTWIEVGHVIGRAKDAGLIDGVKYDHVLPVEIDTTGGGVTQLQIGYNTGEHPFVAAQRFIDAHMLPQYHLAQIADYIQQRTGYQAPTLGMDSTTVSESPAAQARAKHHPMSNIFKYGAEDLERLLPVSKFDKLESAMNAVVNVMSSADRDGIKRGLGRAMTPHLESPIVILQNIRRWALEGLRDEPLVSRLTHLQSPELLGASTKACRTITAKQARMVLANAFLGNCTDVMEQYKDRQGGLNFNNLFREYSRVGPAKAECLLIYF